MELPFCCRRHYTLLNRPSPEHRRETKEQRVARMRRAVHAKIARRKYGWPPPFPALRYLPRIVRLAERWKRPVFEVEAMLSLDDYFDELDGGDWLYDIDNEPRWEA